MAAHEAVAVAPEPAVVDRLTVTIVDNPSLPAVMVTSGGSTVVTVDSRTSSAEVEDPTWVVAVVSWQEEVGMVVWLALEAAGCR